MRLFRIFLTALVIGTVTFAVALAVAWYLLRFAVGPYDSRLPAQASLLSTTDTITIWLGVLAVLVALATLVVTGAGVSIAILAIFGYQGFKEMLDRTEGSNKRVAQEVARTMADTVARKAVSKYLKGKDFHDKLKEVGKDVMWQSGTVTAENTRPLEIPTDSTSIANKYPSPKNRAES